MMNSFRPFYLFAFTLLVIGSSAAFAQDEQQQSEVIPDIQLEFKPAQKEVVDSNVAEDPEITVIQDPHADGDYVPPTLRNLSKLYWRLQIFNPLDNAPVDNFLRINECDIYQNFISDDFEWQDIRSSTREMLKEEAPSFPIQFKVLIPIDFGRYDQEKVGFPLVSDTSFINSRRIQISSGNSERICGDNADIPGYPAGVVLILNKPFTFNFVPVDEHVAQAFLLRKKYNNTPVPQSLKGEGYQRLAYARMRVTFVRYQGNIQGRGGRAEAILYGRLDGIEIFEDPNEQMLLASIDVK